MRFSFVPAPPDLPQKLAVSDHFSCILDQYPEQLIFRRCQRNFLAGNHYLPVSQIDFQLVELNTGSEVDCMDLRIATRMRAISSPELNGLVR